MSKNILYEYLSKGDLNEKCFKNFFKSNQSKSRSQDLTLEKDQMGQIEERKERNDQGLEEVEGRM